MILTVASCLKVNFPHRTGTEGYMCSVMCGTAKVNQVYIDPYSLILGQIMVLAVCPSVPNSFQVRVKLCTEDMDMKWGIYVWCYVWDSQGKASIYHYI